MELECPPADSNTIENIQSVLYELHTKGVAIYSAASYAFTGFTKLQVGNPEVMNELAKTILQDLRKQCPQYPRFTDKLIEIICQDKKLKEDRGIYQAMQKLVSASASCFLNPESLISAAEATLTDINVESLDKYASNDVRKNSAALCFRMTSHWSRSKSSELELTYDESARAFKTSGYNVPLLSTNSTDVGALFKDFCFTLGKFFMAECEAPDDRCYHDETEAEAKQRFEREQAKYLACLKDKIESGELKSDIAYQSQTDDHILAFTCTGDCDALIKRIMEEFGEALPIFRYRQNGVSCLMAGFTVTDLTVFAKRELGKLQKLTSDDNDNLEQRKSTLLKAFDQLLQEEELSKENKASVKAIQESIGKSENRSQVEDNLERARTLFDALTKTSKSFLNWYNTLEDIVKNLFQ